MNTAWNLVSFAFRILNGMNLGSFRVSIVSIGMLSVLSVGQYWHVISWHVITIVSSISIGMLSVLSVVSILACYQYCQYRQY